MHLPRGGLKSADGALNLAGSVGDSSPHGRARAQIPRSTCDLVRLLPIKRTDTVSRPIRTDRADPGRLSGPARASPRLGEGLQHMVFGSVSCNLSIRPLTHSAQLPGSTM